MLAGIEITSSPPYCGLPSLSHQFPVVGVVIEVEVDVNVVVGVDVGVDVRVVVGLDVDTDVGVEIDDDVELVQDASSIAAIIKQLRLDQITLFFIFYLHFFITIGFLVSQRNLLTKTNTAE